MFQSVTHNLSVGIASFVIPFVLSLSYPIGVMLCLPKKARARWIQNNSSFSVFLLSSLPMAASVLALTVDWKLVAQWFSPGSMHPFIIYPGLFVSFILVTLITIDDFTSRPTAPFTLKRAEAVKAIKLETELRAKADEKATPHNHLAAKRKEYGKLVTLGSLKEIAKRGGPVAYIHLALAWLATLFAIMFFWYLVMVMERKVHYKIGPPAATLDKLILVFLLLLTWFPLRLQTEWYQNHFHRDKWLRSYPAFWVLAVLAFVALIVIVILRTVTGSTGLVVLLGAIQAAIGLALGIIGKFKPDWLKAVAAFLERTSFVYFLAIYCIFLMLVSTITAYVIFSTQ
jgi:ABC-type multidrug transport system fused ATPase/permease subunit